MRELAECVRCGRPVAEFVWRCEVHGDTVPLHPPAVAAPTELDQLARQSLVPVWVPRRLPPGWSLSGVQGAGDPRSGLVGALVAASGPSPVGGLADLLLVAEEPGVGLGARLAGLPGPDPGDCLSGLPEAKVDAAGHPTSLWPCPGPADRAVLAGEAKGLWLWAVLFPATASLMLFEDIRLDDARDGGPYPEAGPLTSRLG